MTIGAYINFITGHKYVYLGVTRPDGWNPKGQMDFALSPQVLTCINSDLLNTAVFREDPIQYLWSWHRSIKNWLDVTEMSEEAIQKILADKRKRAVAERI